MYGNITAIFIFRVEWHMRLFRSWSLKTFPVSLVFYELAVTD